MSASQSINAVPYELPDQKIATPYQLPEEEPSYQQDAEYPLSTISNAFSDNYWAILHASHKVCAIISEIERHHDLVDSLFYKHFNFDFLHRMPKRSQVTDYVTESLSNDNLPKNHPLKESFHRVTSLWQNNKEKVNDFLQANKDATIRNVNLPEKYNTGVMKEFYQMFLNIVNILTDKNE